MKPRWLCRNVSCPDCGLVFSDAELNAWDGNGPFDCPRCKTHYCNEDFWEEQYEKWSKTMKEEITN